MPPKKKQKSQEQDLTTEGATPDVAGEVPEVPPSKPLPPSRIKALLAGDMIKAVNKKYGGSYLLRASDRRIQSPKRIPTGVFVLDYALGGGWPTGVFNTVYGPKSAAKTTTILRAVANAQKICGNCFTGSYKDQTCDCGTFRECVAAWLDVEGTLDLAWARKLGVDTDRMLLSIPDFAEQSLDIADQLLRSGDLDVLVLDSIAFLTPEKEIEKSVSDDLMGQQARKVGIGIRKFVMALNYMENTTGRRPTIFFTNQIRMKLGVMFGNPETTPGGMAPGFANSTEVRLSPGKIEVDEKLNKSLTVEMKFRVEKNKTDTPKGEGSYLMCLADTETKKLGDVMDESELIKLAENYGLLTGSGSSYTLFEEKYKGKADLEARLAASSDFKLKISSDILSVVLGSR